MHESNKFNLLSFFGSFYTHKANGSQISKSFIDLKLNFDIFVGVVPTYLSKYNEIDIDTCGLGSKNRRNGAL